MRAHRRLGDDRRERIADGASVLLREQGDSLPDQGIDIGGDCIPGLVQEGGPCELILHLVAQLSKRRPVGARSVSDRHW